MLNQMAPLNGPLVTDSLGVYQVTFANVPPGTYKYYCIPHEAMGMKGTDVAREAADMVLLDDDFATIVSAVREGRRIYDNIRKFVKYTMTSNSGEIWTLLLAPFLGLPLPLLPIHILWINLVTDGLPGLALAAEPHERNIMQRPPRPPRESIFAHGMWQHMIWVGLLIGGLSLLAQAWAYESGWAHWQTMVFTVLTFAQLVHALAIRSERDSLFSIGLLSNLPLLGAVLFTVALQLGVIYLPWANALFRTAPLSAGELLICFAPPLVVLAAVEAGEGAARCGSAASRARRTSPASCPTPRRAPRGCAHTVRCRAGTTQRPLRTCPSGCGSPLRGPTTARTRCSSPRTSSSADRRPRGSWSCAGS